MTLNQFERRAEHRMVARQFVPRPSDLPLPGGDDDGNGDGDGNGNGNGGGDGNGNGGGGGGGGGVSSDPPVSSSTTSSIPPSSTQPPPPPPTPSRSSESSSSTSSSTESSTTSSSSSSASSSSSRSSTRSTSSTRSIPTNNNLRQTSSFARGASVSVAPGVATTSIDSSNTEPTGGVSTGAIVGGIAGGLAALAVLGILIVFLMRKWKNRRQEEEEFGTDFRRSAFVQDSRPSSMAQVDRGLGHNVTPSVSSPGMAGQGAYGSSAPYSDSPSYGASGVTSYGAVGTTAAAAAVASTLQERPKYVYGQADTVQQQEDDMASEHAHGAYSSQPQMMTSYNAETYGSYAAYDPSAANYQTYSDNAGYQDATRQYQAQEGYAVSGDQYNQQYAAGYDQQGYNSYPYDASQGQYAQYDQQGSYAQYDAAAYSTAAAGTAAAATTTAGHKASAPSLGKNNDDAYGGM